MATATPKTFDFSVVRIETSCGIRFLMNIFSSAFFRCVCRAHGIISQQLLGL